MSGIIFEGHRDDLVQLGHRLIDVPEHFRRNGDLAEADHLQPELLGQGLGQLLVGNHAVGDRDLSEQLPPALLLFFQEHAQLAVADEPQIDQNLSDARSAMKIVPLWEGRS